VTIADLPPPVGRTGWPWTVESTAGTGADDGAGPWPKITVVTPSFNQGMFLEETIRSVLLQGYPNLEYIVVDGASTDDSVAIIAKYARHLAWWVSEPDHGPSEAINKGFARATGAVHAYLNSDDLYEPGALRAIGDAFRRGARWVAGDVRYLEDGATWPVPHLSGRRAADWFVTCPISQAGCFWSADLHRELGAFREDLQFFFDYEFWLRLRFIKQLVPETLAMPIALYRLHPRSKTVAENAGFAAERGPIRAEYLRRLPWTDRLQVGAVRRRRRARWSRARAVEAFKAGRRGEGARLIGAALATWPLLAVDWQNPYVIRDYVRGRRTAPEAPLVFPDDVD